MTDYASYPITLDTRESQIIHKVLEWAASLSIGPCLGCDKDMYYPTNYGHSPDCMPNQAYQLLRRYAEL